MSAAFDQDALDTLTPEEIEAIQGDEMDDAERAAMARIAGDAGDDDADADADADAEDDDPDDDGEGDGDDAAEKPEPAAAEAAADEDPDPAPEPQAQPVAQQTAYQAPLPDGYEDKVKSLDSQESDLKARFKAGEMDFEEFDEKRAQIIAERDELRTARVKAEIAREMAEQNAAAQWQRAIDNLATRAATPEGGGVDYRKDAEKAADLDSFVRTLANNPANAERPMEWFLSEAHKRVLALHGLAPARAAAPASADPVAEAKAKRRPPVDAVPKSIAGVPGGDGPGDVGGEFAHLEQLEGWELEEAIARLSPAQRAKYAMGA
jgi:hypothetical protein